jgi:hypothetical protein
MTDRMDQVINWIGEKINGRGAILHNVGAGERSRA